MVLFIMQEVAEKLSCIFIIVPFKKNKTPAL